MIPDNATNLLYFADCLPKKHDAFCQRFYTVLADCKVKHQLLPHTKDIWAVDYMPVQVRADKFVQFVYNPDYLQAQCWQKTISDVDAICQEIGIKPIKSSIKLDGGNVVRSATKVIMCDKVFRENPAIPERQLIKDLETLFETDKLIFIPTQPNDFTGHADGLVRFLDEQTVLINDLSRENTKETLAFARTIRLALHNAGLEYIELLYNPYSNPKNENANGIYLNYLQMKDLVIVPTFDMQDDEQAVRQFETLFTGHRIAALNCNEIAAKGGILNCITWNIAVG